MGESAGNEMTICSGSEEKVRLPIRRLPRSEIIMFQFSQDFFFGPLRNFFWCEGDSKVSSHAEYE